MNQFDETYRKALAGDAKAMFNLSLAYLEGEGTAADSARYFEWTKKAAEAGLAKAMFNLALAYLEGEGTAVDPVQFFEWIKKAAEAGHAEAMYNLALAYLKGEGTAVDPVQFFEWIKNSAEAGHAEAMYNLAFAYLKGEGAAVDPVHFFEWIKKAAEAGHAQAMFNIALAYLKGEGTAADPARYFEWTKKAAEAGHVKAMFNIALAYLKGVGMAADPGRYFEWMEKAAEAGHARAMFNLARAYLKGVGIPVNVDEYFTWVNKAAKCGHVHASMLNHAYCVLRDGEVNPTDILLSNIDKLLNAVNRIKQRHILDDGSIGKNPEIEIAHFTHFQTLEEMLPFKQGNPFPLPNHHFRLYNAEYLNDPHEGCRIFQHMKGHPECGLLYETLFNNLDTESAVSFLHEDLAVYICSCTLRSDRLDLWRAYGKNGDGVCIVTPLSAFEDNMEISYALGEYLKEMRKPEESMQEEMGIGKTEAAMGGNSRQRAQTVPRLLYQVKYQDDEISAAIEDLHGPLQGIVEFMGNGKDKSQLKAIQKCVIFLMSDILYLYKNKEYQNEEEVRMVFAATIGHSMLELDEQNPGRLFMRTDDFLFKQPGSQIIIGPRVKEKRAVELNLKFRLNRHGFKDTRVMQSKVAYR